MADHRGVHAERLDRYCALRSEAGEGLGPYAAATLDFGIRYETAVLEWFDNLPPEVARSRSS